MTNAKTYPTYEVFTIRFKKSHYQFQVISDDPMVGVRYFRKGCRLPERAGEVSKADARLIWKELISRGGKLQESPSQCPDCGMYGCSGTCPIGQAVEPR